MKAIKVGNEKPHHFLLMLRTSSKQIPKEKLQLEQQQ